MLWQLVVIHFNLYCLKTSSNLFFKIIYKVSLLLSTKIVNHGKLEKRDMTEQSHKNFLLNWYPSMRV